LSSFNSTQEKDVATLSVCIRVKKPMAQKKSPLHESAGFYRKPVKYGKNWSKPGQIRSKPAGIEKLDLTGSTSF
jgi:hypothetical protein